MAIKNIQGWHRLGIVLSVFWVLLSSSLYISSIGEYRIWEYGGWAIEWYRFSPFGSSVPLFGNGALPPQPEFDLLGFLVFVGLPVGAIWSVGYAVAWTRQGFKSNGAS